MIKLFIVHQSHLVASLVASLLSDEIDLLVVGQAGTAAEALEQLPRRDADVILIDATLPDKGALDLTSRISAAFPDKKILVFGLPESETVIVQYVMAGADGYVLRKVPAERLLDHVRAAYDDRALISPAMAAVLMEQISELAQMSSRISIQPEAYNELTPREMDVLRLIDKGLTNREIAERLVIEVGTVKNHVHNLLSKLDVSSRQDAAAHLPYIEDRRE